LKKFIAIPNMFRGVGDGSERTIFSAIIDRNAEGFIGCYQKGEALFTRLSSVLEKFKV
jgi:dynein heavy chain 2